MRSVLLSVTIFQYRPRRRYHRCFFVQSMVDRSPWPFKMLFWTWPFRSDRLLELIASHLVIWFGFFSRIISNCFLGFWGTEVLRPQFVDFTILLIFINDLDFDLSDGFHGRIFQKNQWVQQWILGLGRWRWWYLASNVWRLQGRIYSILARIEYEKYEILVRKVHHVFERDLSCDETDFACNFGCNRDQICVKSWLRWRPNMPTI